MKFLGKLVLSSLLCWLTFNPQLSAQVSMFAPIAQADPSTTIQVDVTVEEFINIGGIRVV